MTPEAENATVLWMAKRGGKPIPRDSKTPLEYKLELARRIRLRRKELGLTHKDVVDRLSVAIGREIPADTYRKWETIESIVQVDAILPLCDILSLHPNVLLGRAPGSSPESRPIPRGKAVA